MSRDQRIKLVQNEFWVLSSSLIYQFQQILIPLDTFHRSINLITNFLSEWNTKKKSFKAIESIEQVIVEIKKAKKNYYEIKSSMEIRLNVIRYESNGVDLSTRQANAFFYTLRKRERERARVRKNNNKIEMQINVANIHMRGMF